MKTYEKTREIFDKAAKYYDLHVLDKKSWLYEYYFEGLNQIALEISELLPVNGKLSILDAGCGTGNLLAYLDKYSNQVDYMGIDVSSEMLKIAKKKWANNNFHQSPIENYRESHDIVICSYVLHHYKIDELKDVIANLFKSCCNEHLLVFDIIWESEKDKICEAEEAKKQGLNDIAEEISDEPFSSVKDYKSIAESNNYKIKIIKEWGNKHRFLRIWK
jgi:2-polyprenyl-3-methyl-5-hydroxy-6-metoxy-1,4-benzoquinol methylase